MLKTAVAAARCSASVANWRPETATIEEWRAECLKGRAARQGQAEACECAVQQVQARPDRRELDCLQRNHGLDAAELAGWAPPHFRLLGCQNRGSPDRCLLAPKQGVPSSAKGIVRWIASSRKNLECGPSITA